MGQIRIWEIGDNQWFYKSGKTTEAYLSRIKLDYIVPPVLLVYYGK